MAALPFHYYLALRQDWIAVHAPRPDVEGEDDGSSDVDYNAETFTGEAV